MNFYNKTLANWANYPIKKCEIAFPENQEQIRKCIAQSKTVLARGNGRCYGDAALNERVVSMLNFNNIGNFDENTGEIECEAGVLLSEILAKTLPGGWFFNVTPGIKNITVGGAIASDVHGKNHPRAGCFSNWLDGFELMLASGEIVTCSKSTNSELFWRTCGGMGLTGIVLSAKFRLRKIQSGKIRQTTTKCQTLDQIFQAFENTQHAEYQAAWLDCLPTSRGFGRGVLFSGDHDETPGETFEIALKPKQNVPFFAPSWLLSAFSIGIHNKMIFEKSKPGEQMVGIDKFFYPLDKLANWNRLYGRRGFIQYQFCLPGKNAAEGMGKVLKTIQKSQETPFLTVLKRHGERPIEAVNSFPIRGFSLALDFPRTKTVFDLVRQLDEIVWDSGGKIYLTKDACSAPKMGRLASETFTESKFDSLLKRRINKAEV